MHLDTLGVHLIANAHPMSVGIGIVISSNMGQYRPAASFLCGEAPLTSLFSNPRTFDLRRAIVRESIIFSPLSARPQNTMSLQEAVDNGVLAPTEPLLFFTVADMPLCLSLVDMIYHHVAQGVTQATPWMISFCVICNAGMLFSPVVDGQAYQFGDGGLYNAMTMLTDVETRSLWDHITGDCLHGQHKGMRLAALGIPRQRTAVQVLAEFPAAVIVREALDAEINEMTRSENESRLDNAVELSERALRTLVFNDERLPRFEMGLGVWTETIHRFYRYQDILRDNALLDRVDGRHMLVTVTPDGAAPEAIFVEADGFEWIRDELYLTNGQRVRHGLIYDADGNFVQTERPKQLFQRWYSFALVHPQAEIYQPSG